MKFLSFKILILCILLPPILYIFSLQSIESHLNKRYAKEIGDIYTGDTRPLFDGSMRLKDAINNNIDRYLQSKEILSLGIKAKVTVATKQNTILYPAVFNTNPNKGTLKKVFFTMVLCFSNRETKRRGS